MSYEVQKALVLSTTHLTKEQNDLLTQQGAKYGGSELGIAVDSLAYGYLVYISSEFRDNVRERVPDNIHRAMVLARSFDCDLLRYDADGPIADELPTWEW